MKLAWIGLAGAVLLAACGGGSGGGKKDGGGAGDGGGDAQIVPDGAVDAAPPIDAAPAVDTAVPDAFVFMDAAPPDATIVASCAGVANGTLCSADPNQAERCLNAACVGTYVAPAPAGDDNNPGTRALPKATIAAGITQAVALGAAALTPKPVTVFVGVNAPATSADFAENLSVPANVSLSGGWARDGGGAWTRNLLSNTTRIRPPGAEGVRFADGLATRSNCVMSGFTVAGADQDAASLTASAGITITNGASPALDSLTVTGGAAPQAFSAAVNLTLGTAMTPGSPLITNSTLTGGGAVGAAGAAGTAETSEGLGVGRGTPEVQNSTITGGTATLRSTGINCAPSCGSGGFSPGLLLMTDVVSGGSAPTAQGIALTGDTSGIRIVMTTITGGTPGADNTVGIRDGVNLSTCTGNPVAIDTSTIRGLTGGGVGIARGVHVQDCSLTLTNAPVVVGATGTGGPGFMPVDVARGIHCEGDTSVCNLTANQLIAGTFSPVGISSPALAQSSAIGVIMEGHGTIARTQLIAAGDCVSGMGGATGVRIQGFGRLENNVIVGGACDSSYGIEFTPTPPAAGSNTSVEIVNNHIDAAGSSQSDPTIGVEIDPRQNGAVTGTFMNNTILAGNGATKVVVDESSMNADPAIFVNNNLFGSTVLYHDNGSTNLTTATMVNAITGSPFAAGNISLDPLIMGGSPVNYHLTATSPNRAAGRATTAGLGAGLPTVLAPTNDLDNTDRPQPAGTMPDIGPDEIP